MSSGLRRWRSTQPPASNAIATPGSVSATVRSPRSIAEAPTARIAAIGSAVRVILDPIAEMPCALHNSRKSRWPMSPRLRTLRRAEAVTSYGTSDQVPRGRDGGSPG